jgi:predicted 3-demethylubiquinone-9 3-methyltransferase (glyoxalase superfamily)
MATLDKITPNLWFDKQAEEAAKFYTSIFKNSGIDVITHYTRAGQEIHGMEPGSVMTVEFNLQGQSFVALNGGPLFKFTEAISFVVNCDNQDEIDHYWKKLSEGGDPSAQQCGWLKDKFGLSWQVVPSILSILLQDEDREKAERAMAAMMKMKKLEVQELKDAFNGYPHELQDQRPIR